MKRAGRPRRGGRALSDPSGPSERHSLRIPPAVRAETPKRVEAPQAAPPRAEASRSEQDELAAALEEMELEQNQEQQRKAGR